MAQTKLAFASSVLPVGAAEVAARLGVKPQTVHTWRQRNLMPEPRWTVSGQPAWDWSEIEAWAKRTGRLREDDIYADMLALEGSGWKGDLEQMRTDRAAKS
jgi:predicted DNA-binding transcriptional regulator AlpA